MRIHPSSRVHLATRAALAGLLVLTLAAACSDDGTKASAKATTTATEGKAAFTVTAAAVDSPGADVAFPDEVKTQLTAALDTWANGAVITPMRTGTVGDLGAFFSAGTAPRVAEGAADRPVFFETDLKATAPVTVKGATTTFTGLADTGGNIQLVNAQVSLALRSATTSGPVSVNRAGNIIFVPGPQGWQVGYYDLVVDRAGKGLGTAPAHTTASTTKGA